MVPDKSILVGTYVVNDQEFLKANSQDTGGVYPLLIEELAAHGVAMLLVVA